MFKCPLNVNLLSAQRHKPDLLKPIFGGNEAATLSVCSRVEFCGGYHTRFNSAQSNSISLSAIPYFGTNRPWLLYFNRPFVLKLSDGLICPVHIFHNFSHFERYNIQGNDNSSVEVPLNSCM